MLQMLLNGGTYGGKRYIKEDVVKQFTSQQSPKSSRGIGWDTNNSRNRWTGTKLSQKSFIHTGFTGTSVVADPERNLIIVFLTNRVYPTRAQGKISRFRPAVHNAIVEALK